MDGTPSFYDPSRIGTLFYPDVERIAREAKASALAPSAGDHHRVHLLIVDMQIDFCHRQGTLYVPGAEGDIRRLIEFIFRHAERITTISCSLDSHLPLQIFHPAWWADQDGNHPAPFTVITPADLEAGIWRPRFMPDWSRDYVKRLEESAKKALVIWPFHVPIGGIGSSLDPELWSTVMWHSLARQSQPLWWTKGSIAQTEHYSIIQPEIPVPDHPQGGTNRELLRTLEQYDSLVIAGEAESHCVLETVEDLVGVFADNSDFLSKIYVLRDCTSPVLHPEVDFHTIAVARFAEFESKGVNFVESTDLTAF